MAPALPFIAPPRTVLINVGKSEAVLVHTWGAKANGRKGDQPLLSAAACTRPRAMGKMALLQPPARV